MDMALIILKQTLTMAIYMAAGWLLFKSGKITREGSKVLASLLLYLIIPAMMIRSFCVEFSMDKLLKFGQSFLLCSIAMLISTTVGKLLLRKHPIDCFAVAFSNAGFMGIPLITAALNADAVFYITGMLIWVNLLQWSWGYSVIGGQKVKFTAASLIKNPFIITTALGLVLFVTGLGAKMPAILYGAIDGTANLTTPIAMIVLGVYMAQTKFSTLFTTPRLYLVSVIRLWLIPVITLLVFSLFPFDNTIRMAVLISSSTAVGSNVAVYAQMHDADYPYACQTVTLCTLASIVMMPLFIMLASRVLGM